MKEVLTALITPFCANLQIDDEALHALIEEQLLHGCDGFIVCGTTGEVATLTSLERMHILDLVIAHVHGRAAIWYGCGSNNTVASLHALDGVKDKSITGVLLVTPYYNRPSPEGIYQHFACLAHHTHHAIMLYNVPSRCGCAINAKTLDCLLDTCPNIKALKHASDDLSLVRPTLKKHPSFHIYSGEDALFNEGFALGMCGLVSVMSHVVMQELKQYCKQGRTDEHMASLLKEWAKMSFIESSPAPIKYMMAKQKRCENILRLPLVPITNKNQNILDQWMANNDKICP